MEIKEVWTELKDRVNNPLFGSFVLSWLACNWWFPVLLFFYKQEDLIKTKTTYIDAIQRKADWCHMLILPLLIAAFYTWASPRVRGLVKRYTANIDRSTDETIDKDAGKRMVPVGDLMLKRRELRSLETDLQQLVLSEREISDNNVDLKQQISALEAEIVRMESHNLNVIESMKVTHILELETANERAQFAKADFMKEHEQDVNYVHHQYNETKDTVFSILNSVINDLNTFTPTDGWSATTLEQIRQQTSIKLNDAKTILAESMHSNS